jgi:hypothetical protein
MAQVSCWYTCYLRNVVLNRWSVCCSLEKIGLIKCPTGVFVSWSCRERDGVSRATQMTKDVRRCVPYHILSAGFLLDVVLTQQ